MTMNVRIAVLMAAYNADATLKRAVDSVRASVVPVDLYIIDDASATPVEQVLGGSLEGVFVHRLPHNGGLARALNAGIEIIRSKSYDFIARFDADDYCYPDRFAIQAAYMKDHPDIDIVGGWVRVVDEQSGQKLYDLCQPEQHDDLVRAMKQNMAFVHPALMFRSHVFDRLAPYDPSYRAAEDYDLMARAMRLFRVANVPQIIMDYTYNPSGISQKKRRRQLWDRLRVQLRFFDPFRLASWTGVLRTLLFFVLPNHLILWLKKRGGR